MKAQQMKMAEDQVYGILTHTDIQVSLQDFKWLSFFIVLDFLATAFVKKKRKNSRAKLVFVEGL